MSKQEKQPLTEIINELYTILDTPEEKKLPEECLVRMKKEYLYFVLFVFTRWDGKQSRADLVKDFNYGTGLKIHPSVGYQQIARVLTRIKELNDKGEFPGHPAIKFETTITLI